MELFSTFAEIVLPGNGQHATWTRADAVRRAMRIFKATHRPVQVFAVTMDGKRWKRERLMFTLQLQRNGHSPDRDAYLAAVKREYLRIEAARAAKHDRTAERRETVLEIFEEAQDMAARSSSPRASLWPKAWPDDGRDDEVVSGDEVTRWLNGCGSVVDVVPGLRVTTDAGVGHGDPCDVCGRDKIDGRPCRSTPACYS